VELKTESGNTTKARHAAARGSVCGTIEETLSGFFPETRPFLSIHLTLSMAP
jgi:hypothetical protein